MLPPPCRSFCHQFVAEPLVRHLGSRARVVGRDRTGCGAAGPCALVGFVPRSVCEAYPKQVSCWNCSVVPAVPCVKDNIVHVQRVGKEVTLQQIWYTLGSRVIFFHSEDQSQSQRFPARAGNATRCSEPPPSAPPARPDGGTAYKHTSLSLAKAHGSLLVLLKPRWPVTSLFSMSLGTVSRRICCWANAELPFIFCSLMSLIYMELHAGSW